jgi:aminomuconate-semialdehyde/2-hydroxymuconate-6-semialdehyde dehydrogenase
MESIFPLMAGEQVVYKMERILNFINGQFSPSKSGKSIECFNPALDMVYATLPASNSDDVEYAILAAENAKKSWAESSNEYRSNILLKIADLIDQNIEKLARAESIDNGKPLNLAMTVDIPRAAQNFRFFGAAIINESSEAHLMSDDAVNYTRKTPLGIVACISPWNLPLYLFTWKIAPALATGNCVIAKPSEITPMTAFLLASICKDAGLPDGVLNILHGYGHEVGAAMVMHPKVKAISFTGGTSTGKTIASIAAPLFKKTSLELGGKNPTIIYDDCDYNTMLDTTVRSSFTNQGEICLCGSRIFVEQSIYQKFTKDFTERVKNLSIGDPLLSVDLGAIVSKEHLAKIERYVDLAKKDGGKILTGGKRPQLSPPFDKGYFFEPTVIVNLDNKCQINQEEIFGPVVTILPFNDEADVVNQANDTDYGLACSIWTNDIDKAHRTAQKIETGIIWINCWMVRDLRTPFGGMKSSGIGREGGSYGLNFFRELKNICLKIKKDSI